MHFKKWCSLLTYKSGRSLHSKKIKNKYYYNAFLAFPIEAYDSIYQYANNWTIILDNSRVFWTAAKKFYLAWISHKFFFILFKRTISYKINQLIMLFYFFNRYFWNWLIHKQNTVNFLHGLWFIHKHIECSNTVKFFYFQTISYFSKSFLLEVFKISIFHVISIYLINGEL